MVRCLALLAGQKGAVAPTSSLLAQFFLCLSGDGTGVRHFLDEIVASVRFGAAWTGLQASLAIAIEPREAYEGLDSAKAEVETEVSYASIEIGALVHNDHMER